MKFFWESGLFPGKGRFIRLGWRLSPSFSLSDWISALWRYFLGMSRFFLPLWRWPYRAEKASPKSGMDNSFLTSFFVLAFLGLLDSGYLAWAHFRRKKLICPLSHDCSIVTESRWSSIFGVRNDYLGFLFYLSLLIAGLSAVFLPASAERLLKLALIATIGAAIFSWFLVLIQTFSLKTYCLYCLASALIVTLLLINTIALVF